MVQSSPEEQAVRHARALGLVRGALLAFSGVSSQGPRRSLSGVRRTVYGVYTGTVLWFLFGLVRLAIWPLRTLGVFEVSWLACPVVAVILYLWFPALRYRFVAVTRVVFYTGGILVLLLTALLTALASLTLEGPIYWAALGFALNGLLLLLAVRRGRPGDRLGSTSRPDASPKEHSATSLRMTSVAIGWVILATAALTTPLIVLGATLATQPYQLWRYLLLLLVWLCVNADALYIAHRGYASARIGIILTLLVTFYVLALLWAFILFNTQDPLPLWLGVLILVSLFPLRFSKNAPGVRVFRSSEPALWEVIEKVAAATHQRPPDALYVAADVNAYASRRLGVNHLILGLPLIAILRTSELRAVIAHEFGHYLADDTVWAVRIYRCRHAVENVITRFTNLEEMLPNRCNTGLIRFSIRLCSLPFRTYNLIFRRALRAVIEAQEYSADQVASAIAGRHALCNAIRAVEKASPAFSHYWRVIVLPVIRMGYMPRLSQGFVEYIRNGAESSRLDEGQLVPAAGFAALEFHPSVHNRLSRLVGEQDPPCPAPDPPALTLLHEVERYEKELFHHLGFNDLSSHQALATSADG